MTPRIILDLSRLLSRAGRPAPTGIDRVELAYARRLIAACPERLSFAAMANWGRFGPLPARAATEFVRRLDELWSGGKGEPAPGRLALDLHLALAGGAGAAGLGRPADGPSVYLLLSHHHLDRADLIGRIKARTGARFCCLVHDLIPIELPEYARPGQTRRHVERMRTVERLADGVIVNSSSTGAALERRIAGAGRAPPILVAPLGVDPPADAPMPPVEAQEPYFVVLGTLEPKKNHLLLLNLWRRMAERHGDGAPRLVLIGQRGWMAQNVVDMLERSPAVRRLVREHGGLPDAAVRPLLQRARALLMPSFAEGFGLPVAEALAQGTPVICSDLPALREAGGGAPEYLDPLDGPAWEAAILDYASPDSLRRAAQIRRIADYRPPGWAGHFERVMPFLERVCVGGQPAAAPRAWPSEAQSTG